MDFKSIISDLYQREFLKLRAEINAYQTPSNMWVIDGKVNNSAGNLCLHLIGNINHFIGALLGNTGYVRNRDLEFSDKDVPLETINKMLDGAEDVLNNVLPNLTDAELESIYPATFLGEKSTAFMLMFFSNHLSYHVGQISYHRRLVDN